jgi:hypothetical protein
MWREAEILGFSPPPASRTGKGAGKPGGGRAPSAAVRPVQVIEEDWRTIVPNSILEAIKLGQWDYEPEEKSAEQFESTVALPGSEEKLGILAMRVQQGHPLWHRRDRTSFDDDLD